MCNTVYAFINLQEKRNLHASNNWHSYLKRVLGEKYSEFSSAIFRALKVRLYLFTSIDTKMKILKGRGAFEVRNSLETRKKPCFVAIFRLREVIQVTSTPRTTPLATRGFSSKIVNSYIWPYKGRRSLENMNFLRNTKKKLSCGNFPIKGGNPSHLDPSNYATDEGFPVKCLFLFLVSFGKTRSSDLFFRKI